MKIAICHDYLTQRGGAERVVLSLSDTFPTAPIHTSLYLPGATFEDFGQRDVRASLANRVVRLRDHHRAALPLYPLIFETQRIDADVTICSSSGWAHGARVTGRKVVYCHAPARWLYQSDTYLAGFSASARRASPMLLPTLLRWDRRAAASADLYLANSTRTRDMIWQAYGIEAEVLHPPPRLDPSGPQTAVEGLDPGFHLCVSRLLSYKNLPQLVEAFRGLPDERLVLVGEGPLETALRASSPPNVSLVGTVGDDELRWLYANAQCLLGVSYEDLGLTPIEAAAFGTPTIALRFGGYLDTVIEGVNGTFIEEPTTVAIRAAVAAGEYTTLDPTKVRVSAKRFSRPEFEARLRVVVVEELAAPT